MQALRDNRDLTDVDVTYWEEFVLDRRSDATMIASCGLKKLNFAGAKTV